MTIFGGSLFGPQQRVIYSPGFCAPIVWGVANGYAPAEIAAGLDITVGVVIDALQQHAGRTIVRRAASPRDAVSFAVDPSRKDRRYVAWLATRRAAALAREAAP